MKVDILDSGVFFSLVPDVVQPYLKTLGWHEIRRVGDTVSIWEHVDASGTKHRVWVPLDVTLTDYATAVGRLVRTLAEVTDHSQLQIVEDLGTIGIGDVIRMGTWDILDRGTFTIPILEGQALIDSALKMTRSAACSAVNPRPVHPHRPTQAVSHYMNQVRLGQTERGSYLVKVISPVKDEDFQPQMSYLSAQELPFGRKVVMSLVRSLDALERTANDTARRDKFFAEPFEEIVQEGISANLCEALTPASTLEKDAFRMPLEVAVSWSYLLEAPAVTVDRTFRFEGKSLTYIAQAAKALRAKHPETVQLTGIVTGLKRESTDSPGDVIILVTSGEQAGNRIRVQLEGDSYEKAVISHPKYDQVACEGTLVKQGMFYRLQDPTNFRILKDDSPGDQLGPFNFGEQ